MMLHLLIYKYNEIFIMTNLGYYLGYAYLTCSIIPCIKLILTFSLLISCIYGPPIYMTKKQSQEKFLSPYKYCVYGPPMYMTNHFRPFSLIFSSKGVSSYLTCIFLFSIWSSSVLRRIYFSILISATLIFAYIVS